MAEDYVGPVYPSLPWNAKGGKSYILPGWKKSYFIRKDEHSRSEVPEENGQTSLINIDCLCE